MELAMLGVGTDALWPPTKGLTFDSKYNNR